MGRRERTRRAERGSRHGQEDGDGEEWNEPWYVLVFFGFLFLFVLLEYVAISSCFFATQHFLFITDNPLICIGLTTASSVAGTPQTGVTWSTLQITNHAGSCLAAFLVGCCADILYGMSPLTSSLCLFRVFASFHWLEHSSRGYVELSLVFPPFIFVRLCFFLLQLYHPLSCCLGAPRFVGPSGTDIPGQCWHGVTQGALLLDRSFNVSRTWLYPGILPLGLWG